MPRKPRIKLVSAEVPTPPEANPLDGTDHQELFQTQPAVPEFPNLPRPAEEEIKGAGEFAIKLRKSPKAEPYKFKSLAPEGLESTSTDEVERPMDPEFKTERFWEHRFPQRIKEKVVAGLMLGMTLMGPVATEAGPRAGGLHSETTTSEKTKDLWLGAHQTVFVRGADGESHFNPWGVIFPGQVELSSKTEKNERVRFELPYEYSRLFDTGKPLSAEDHQKIADYIDQKLKEEFVDKLYGFDINKNVYKANHGELGSRHPKITGVTVTGYASPEGPRSKGPSTIEPGHVDDENLKLALKRAEVGMGLTTERLKELGITSVELEKGAMMIGGRELQNSSQEMAELAILAEGEKGVDPAEKIYNLTIKYNNKKIDDPQVLEALDRIIGSKRKVAVTVSSEGGESSTDLYPVPNLLLLPLLLIRRRRRDGEEEPIPDPTPPSSEPKLLTGLEIPPKFKEVNLPDPSSPEYEEMEEQTMLDDLYRNFDDLDKRRRGLSYNDISENLYTQYEQFPDDSAREEFLAAKILLGWKDHDRMARKDAGIEGDEIDRGLDYENQDNQILWAKMHARKLFEIIKQRKALEASGTKQGYPILMSDEFIRLLKRREARLNPDATTPTEAQIQEEAKPVTPEPEFVPEPEIVPSPVSNLEATPVSKEEVLSAHKEMSAFRLGKKVAELSLEFQEKYKQLKAIWQAKKEAWLAQRDKLPEDQQDEPEDLAQPKETQERLATMTSEQVVEQALGETLGTYNNELAVLDAEIKEMERLIKYSKDTGRGVTALGSEDELKELKARRRALVAKIASMPAEQTKPEDDLAGETIIKPETAPQSVLDFERAQADAKTNRREAQQNGVNELSRRIDTKNQELGELTAWNTWRKLQVHREIDQLTAERARLQKELNGEQRKIGFGERFRHVAKKAYRNIKEKIKGDGEGSTARFWGQRAVGLMTFGFWDAHKAEKFRVGTKKTAKEAAQSAEEIQKQGNLSVEDAQAEAMEMGDTTGKKSAEIEKLSQEITDRKVKENDAKINEIIVGVITGLEEKLKKYKGDRGENVLTEDAKNKIAIDLQQRLNQMRTAYTDADSKEITKMLRESLDPKWWQRYVWAGLEFATASLITYVGASILISKFTAAKVGAAGAKVGAKEATTALLKDTIWGEAKRQLVAHGVTNPTMGQIQQVATKFCVDSGVKVMEGGQLLWPHTAGGVATDIALAKDFPISIAGGLKIIAQMAAKMAIAA